jgi:hypothetical protein
MLTCQTCVSGDYPAYLVSLDSYHSDLPEPITAIYVEIDFLHCVGCVHIFRIPV